MIDITKLNEFHKYITPEWLAGFFDGEGCISVSKRKNNYDLTVELSQKDSIILGLILLKFPEGALRQYGSKRVWKFILGGNTAKRFLIYIKDFSVVKKSQIIAALEYIETIAEQTGIRTNTNDLQIRAKVFNILKKEKEVIQ